MTDTRQLPATAEGLAGMLADLALVHAANDVVVDLADPARIGRIAYRARGTVTPDAVLRPALAKTLEDVFAGAGDASLLVETASNPQVKGVSFQWDAGSRALTARVMRRTILDGLAPRR